VHAQEDATGDGEAGLGAALTGTGSLAVGGLPGLVCAATTEAGTATGVQIPGVVESTLALQCAHIQKTSPASQSWT